MGKHDRVGHELHPSKQVRFKQPKPSTTINDHTVSAPQNPHIGSNEKNQYR